MFADWAAALETGVDARQWFRTLFYWLFSPRFFDDERAVEDASNYAVAYPYPQTATAFRNQVGAIAAFDGAQSLCAIRARTLVVAGADDLLFPLAECRRFASAMRDAAFVAIDAAHSLHVENPTAFVQSVREFLSSSNGKQ